MSKDICTADRMALYTVHGQGERPPSLASAAAQLSIAPEDIDAAFGVVMLDPAAGLYAVQARADRVAAVPQTGQRYEGPYSSPPIAPFGPETMTNEDD